MHQNLSKAEIISKISADPLFKNAEKYKVLLQYLFKCYKNDKIPTEFDIAADVFFRDKDFNPADDTTVRVYIYRLRKKLDEYYEGSGKHDSVVVQIQKGTYHIEFIKHSELNKKNLLKFNQYIYPAIILVLLIIIAFLTLEFISVRDQLHKIDDIRENKLIWADFTGNGLPTLYSVGSLFAYNYYMKQFNRSWLVRDDAINNEQELAAFQENFKLNENDISIPDWKMIPKSAAMHYGNFLPIFQLNEKKLNLKLTDELTWNEIENNNIIYVGHFHNLNILKTMLPNKRIIPQIKVFNHGEKKYYIKVKTSEIDTLYPIILNTGGIRTLETDYVVVSKIPGPRNNTVLFICSFSSMGRLKMVETLTSPELLRQFERKIEKKTNKIPKYFEMLVKVSGFKDTGLETTIMHYFELPPGFVLMKGQSPNNN